MPVLSLKLKEDAVAKLKALQGPLDPEMAHSDADEILCELLIELGFDAVVAEWRKVDKWYS
ncbi:hypothetical protein [Ensifer adhaerens]|uniref:Uncharacterized protein n=1 Tax=Ensifer adhaerens TaxID=106592 RepID=A0ABY8HCJ6_ENSAD|nr:hypothetical protein [Ensifer adhaerens]WFP89826.1 hypothetical protein P4B07_14830 [Ensifer adhaerens]